MTPLAENATQPTGRPYGERVAEEIFLQESAPQQQIQPNFNFAIPEQPLGVEPTQVTGDEVVVPGVDLSPDELGVLLGGDEPVSNPTDQATDFSFWGPVLNEIAQQPGAGEGMRRIADYVNQRQ